MSYLDIVAFVLGVIPDGKREASRRIFRLANEESADRISGVEQDLLGFFARDFTAIPLLSVDIVNLKRGELDNAREMHIGQGEEIYFALLIERRRKETIKIKNDNNNHDNNHDNIHDNNNNNDNTNDHNNMQQQ